MKFYKLIIALIKIDIRYMKKFFIICIFSQGAFLYAYNVQKVFSS